MAGLIVVFPDKTWAPLDQTRIVAVSDEEIEDGFLHTPIPEGEPASAAFSSLESAAEGQAPREIGLHVRMLMTRYLDPEIKDQEKESIRAEIERVYLKAAALGALRGEHMDCTTQYQREEEPWTLRMARNTEHPSDKRCGQSA